MLSVENGNGIQSQETAYFLILRKVLKAISFGIRSQRSTWLIEMFDLMKLLIILFFWVNEFVVLKHNEVEVGDDSPKEK